MLNRSLFTKAAIFLLSFCAVGGYAISAVNWNTAGTRVPNFFSLVLTSTSGQEMYTVYCAGCHGKDGRGKGQSSRLCTVPPADLTQFARNNHGVFPAKWISGILHHGTGRPPTGQGYMPVWEPLLSSLQAEPSNVTETRLQNLPEYVKTLQVKTAIHYD
jgi:mono/diheme cytochrome c family protein